jgi:hypothetical protein
MMRHGLVTVRQNRTLIIIIQSKSHLLSNRGAYDLPDTPSFSILILN